MALDSTTPIRSGRLRTGRKAAWLWTTALYLLALVPPGAQAADATIEQKAQACVACHGPNGQSATPTVPSLAGQTSRYIYEQLRDFAAGRRESATMTPLAKTLSAPDMLALGEYFSARRPMSSSYVTDPAKVAHGESIAGNALCTMCHEAALAGQNEIPRVGGQQYEYIVKELESFRSGHRTNDGGAMQAVVRGMSDEDVEAVAQYVTNLN